MDQLSKVKIKLGYSLEDTSQDNLLQIYLDDAKEYILGAIHQDAIPDGLLSAQVEIAIIFFNKLGIEGESAHNEGGINRTFEGIPDSILKRIKSFRKLQR
ncbi:phage head-tail connector protein [Clostridium sp. 19966]|uniref:phage head-tail connector protein n=1 Tax=Clostridium sp. 19966 TaxID=2768166 RepID=UPI0028DE6C52|nr:phage head-tail connector protein [Clostridium sp. 19966]MDT8715442.1 phage head-tail connector protein [Clostridium sp. 19966]